MRVSLTVPSASAARPALPRPRDQSAAIYRALKEMIASGVLTPGIRLVEKQLASRFGTSRTPVRAALDRLEQEGFVITTPGLRHSLSQVAPLTMADGADVLSVLAALDGAAARRAAELPGPERRALAASMREVNVKLGQAGRARRPQPALVHELDDEFHRLFIAAAAGPRLAAMAQSIRPQVTRYGRIYTTLLVQRVTDSVAEHTAVVHGIERGNADAAERAAAFNHRNAAARLAEAISNMGERGSW